MLMMMFIFKLTLLANCCSIFYDDGIPETPGSFYFVYFFCFAARKIPMLFFTGDIDGTLTKWEQSQSNNFVYR